VHSVRKDYVTESISTQNLRRDSGTSTYARSALTFARSVWKFFQTRNIKEEECDFSHER
jgi:hypothetical protein